MANVSLKINNLTQKEDYTFKLPYIYCDYHNIIHGLYELASLASKNSTLVNLQVTGDAGLSRDLNPGPPAPKAGIIPLDH